MCLAVLVSLPSIAHASEPPSPGPLTLHFSSLEQKRALKSLDAVARSYILTEGLKYLFQERRPDSDARDSFPSTHAGAAFALAVVQSHYKPDQASYWYGAAVAVSASRVIDNRHYVHDVVGGAVVGYFAGRSSLRGDSRFHWAPGGTRNEPLGLRLRLEF